MLKYKRGYKMKKFKKIYVEITNLCNLSCPFCNINTRIPKSIKIDEFNTLLDKIKDDTDYLYFHMLGEPLLHKDINQLVDLAYNKKFNINITTNGYLIRNIKTQNIRQINISLHSYSEKYNKTLDEYLKDIFEVVEKLDNTYISYRLWTNTKYKENILNKLEEKYNIKIDNNKNTKLNKNVYLNIDEEFIWPSLDNDYYTEIGMCNAINNHIGILVDGTVVPCCLDTEGIIKLGNIYENSLENIINGNKYKNIVKNFKNNKRCEQLCKKCSFK